MLFYREALDRWGVRAQFSGREEYKSAMNSLTERGFTRAQRANLESILGNYMAQLTAAAAADREKSAAAVRALVDASPLTAEQARARAVRPRPRRSRHAPAPAAPPVHCSPTFVPLLTRAGLKIRPALLTRAGLKA